MDINYQTIYSGEKLRGLRGRNASVTTRRRNIEDFFGDASLTGHEASDEGKINFLWAIEIEKELMVYIWDYKYYGQTDMYQTKTWSIGGSALAVKMLAEITGWEIGRDFERSTS